MTSFFAAALGTIPHLPETVCAVLSAARPLMNSSIVPVVLSTDDGTWDKMCSSKPTTNDDERKNRSLLQQQLLKVFSSFSQTMQFTEKFRVVHSTNPPEVAEDILKHLINNTRYFSRTVKHIQFPSTQSILTLCGEKVDIRLQNIHSIDLRWCRNDLKAQHLDLICKNFPMLEKLNLAGKAPNVTSEGFQSISGLRSLRELDLSWCSSITTLPFLKDCLRLETLRLKSCSLLSVAAFDVGVDLPSLREVNLEHCDNTSNATLIKHLQEYAPNLTSLECRNVEGERSFEIISKMTMLKILLLHNCSTLSENAIEMISSNLDHLETLNMYSSLETCVSDTYILHISKSSSLRNLVLRECSDFTNVGFKHLAAMKNLEKLELYSNSNTDFTGDIGDQNSFSQSLTELHLVRLESIGTQGLQSTLKNLSLRTLVLHGCGNVTSESLKKALETSNCKASLEDLSVTGCHAITDCLFVEGLVSLEKLDLSATACSSGSKFLPPTLKHLDLSNLYKLEDSFLLEIPENVRSNIEVLLLYCCCNLTDAMFDCVSQMRSLRLLVLDYEEDECGFSLAGVERILSKTPYLETLVVGQNVCEEMSDAPELRGKLEPLMPLLFL